MFVKILCSCSRSKLQIAKNKRTLNIIVMTFMAIWTLSGISLKVLRYSTKLSSFINRQILQNNTSTSPMAKINRNKANFPML